MKKHIDLTDEQARMLYYVINNAQGYGVDFLMKFESGIFKSKQLKQCYDETKREFEVLQQIKNKL